MLAHPACIGADRGEAMTTTDRPLEPPAAAAYYRELVDASRDIIIRYDLEGRVTFVNQAVLQATGAPFAAVVGRSDRELGAEESFAARWDSLLARVRTGETVDTEQTRPVPRGGSPRTYDLHLSPIRDEAGAIVGVLCSGRDITSRKAAEQALRTQLRAQEVLARSATELLRVGAEFDAAVVGALRAFAELAGAFRAAIWKREGDSIVLVHEWVSPAYAAAPRAPVLPATTFATYARRLRAGEAVAAGRPAEIPEDALGEREFTERHGFQPLLFVPLISGENYFGTLGFYGQPGEERTWPQDLIAPLQIAGAILVNAFERRRAEAALRANEQRLVHVLECSPVGICLLDERGQLTFANSAAEELAGMPRSLAVGQPRSGASWAASTLDGQPIAEEEMPVARALRTGQPVRVELAITRADGRRVPLDVNAAPLRDESSGALCGAVSAFVDLSERVRQEEERRHLEQQIQQAQKLESLGVLAGGIAHDFNNLLVGVLGNLDLALADLSPLAPACAPLRDAETAARRAAELTRQLLAYSGKGRFVVQPLQLGALVEEMVHILHLSISKKATLRLELAPGLPCVEADEAQLRQVVMNLVLNAAEAIGDQRGVVAVSTSVLDCDREALAGDWLPEPLAPGRYLCLEVADTGAGMDEATRARIFDPFFTTKFTGRGLGLAAVLGIIRGHRGAIRVESEPGKGSRFRVLLPATEHQVEVLAEPGDERWQASGTVLLVDDEEVVRQVGARMLERLGLRVLCARDGRQAVELFRAHADEVRCVLLDLTMPVMDGEETLRELQRVRTEVRVILTSGFSEQEVQLRFAGRGLVDFLQKPFRLETLRSRLRVALQIARSGAALAGRSA